MTRPEIATIVRDVLFSTVQTPHAFVEAADDITPEMRLVEDLGCDSLDKCEIVISLEDRLNIEIADDAVESLITVEDAEKLVAKLKGVTETSPR